MRTNGIARKPYSARMRDLNDDVTTLEVNTGENGEAQVEIPGFGVLLVGKVTSDELIDRLVSQWKAILVQPDDKGMFSSKSSHIRLPAKVVLAHVEIDIPNKADRLTVILVP